MSNETEAPELIRAIEAIPTRTEMISGQAFRYVKLSEVLDLLDTRADLSDAKDKRIEELEAKLAKAVVELESLGQYANGMDLARLHTTLAELKNNTATRG